MFSARQQMEWLGRAGHKGRARIAAVLFSWITGDGVYGADHTVR